MTTETKSTDSQATQPSRSCCCGPTESAADNAREILDRRYASGDITREQYEQLRSAIAADSNIDHCGRT
jgi:hypothetical protein